MNSPLPAHKLLKNIRRARLTPDDAMAAKLEAFAVAVPQISKASLARIARKDARILEITPETFSSNVQRTSDVLGVTTKAFFKLAAQQPALVYTSPQTNRLKLTGLARALGIRLKDFLPVVRKNPAILSRNEGSVLQAIAGIADHLDLAQPSAVKLFLRWPTLINITTATMASNVEGAARLLDVPVSTYARAARSQPQLLYQSPQTILSNAVRSAHALGCDLPVYVEMAARAPSLFSRSPVGLPRRARLIRCLLHYTRDTRTLHDLLAVLPTALTYSPQRLIARCLIARYGLSGLRASTLLILSNEKATALLRAHLKQRHGKDVYRYYRRWKALGLLIP